MIGTRTPVADPAIDVTRLETFVRAAQGPSAELLDLQVHPLAGLESAAVARVRARLRAQSGRAHVTTFVVKRLDAAMPRERIVYESVLSGASARLAPRLLGTDQLGPATCYLYLEWVRPWRVWPWGDMRCAGLVLEQLAYLHTSVSAESAHPPQLSWDYEQALLESSRATLELAEGCLRLPELRHLAHALPSLRRLVSQLPSMRAQLLGQGRTVIHGDAHSGNAFIRVQRGEKQAVLLDWSRARLGAPMEDVCSWLQSLGLWEPEARRRHDTLLRHYLIASGRGERVTRELRDAYWLAGACNALAGALRYHLAVASGWGSPAPAARRAAIWAARAHLRLIRRADAIWRA